MIRVSETPRGVNSVARAAAAAKTDETPGTILTVIFCFFEFRDLFDDRAEERRVAGMEPDNGLSLLHPIDHEGHHLVEVHAPAVYLFGAGLEATRTGLTSEPA